jgi:hypothetical protein
MRIGPTTRMVVGVVEQAWSSLGAVMDGHPANLPNKCLWMLSRAQNVSLILSCITDPRLNQWTAMPCASKPELSLSTTSQTWRPLVSREDITDPSNDNTTFADVFHDGYNWQADVRGHGMTGLAQSVTGGRETDINQSSNHHVIPTESQTSMSSDAIRFLTLFIVTGVDQSGRCLAAGPPPITPPPQNQKIQRKKEKQGEPSMERFDLPLTRCAASIRQKRSVRVFGGQGHVIRTFRGALSTFDHVGKHEFCRVSRRASVELRAKAWWVGRVSAKEAVGSL